MTVQRYPVIVWRDHGDLFTAAFVEDLRGLLDHLGVERAALVAQSMGGLTCLSFTVAYPERVWALVMGNTFAGMRREVWLAADEGLRSQAQAFPVRSPASHERSTSRRPTGVVRYIAPHSERASGMTVLSGCSRSSRATMFISVPTAMMLPAGAFST